MVPEDSPSKNSTNDHRDNSGKSLRQGRGSPPRRHRPQGAVKKGQEEAKIDDPLGVRAASCGERERRGVAGPRDVRRRARARPPSGGGGAAVRRRHEGANYS